MLTCSLEMVTLPEWNSSETAILVVDNKKIDNKKIHILVFILTPSSGPE